MDVGKRMIALREQAGLTTNRLANLCGLSQSFVRAVEIGEKGITVENLSLICDALHITLHDFFTSPASGDDWNALVQPLTEPQRNALKAFLTTLDR